MERIKKAIQKARSSIDTGLPAEQLGTDSGRARRRLDPKPRFEPRVVEIDSRILERHRIISLNKTDRRAISFDLLRTKILQAMQKNSWRTVAITSPRPGCGKTTVAVNLSFSIAQQTSPSVLLGDFDLRHPKVGHYLGITSERDLSDFLDGRAHYTEAIVNPGIPRLLILPNNKAYANAAEMLTTHEIRTLVDGLTSAKDASVIIFDLPPMLPTDDAIAFLPHVDCVLLVVADGVTTRPELEETLRLLQGANLIGVVLNKSDAKQPIGY